MRSETQGAFYGLIEAGTGARNNSTPTGQKFEGIGIMKKTIIAVTFLLLTGCSIRQTVKQVELSQPMEICIVKNEKVRPSFLNAYSDALKAKSVQVRTLAEGASLNECPTTSTYAANWTWDLAMYMKYAEIKVYRSAALVGEAVYDASWGGGRLDKFINAENKIRELVDELFTMRGGDGLSFAPVGFNPANP